MKKALIGVGLWMLAGVSFGAKEHKAPFEDDDFDPMEVFQEEVEGFKALAEVPGAWAPPKPRVQAGEKVITCVATSYQDKVGAGRDVCLGMAKGVAQFYERASKGKLRLQPKVEEMSFPQAAPQEKGEVYKISDAIKAKIKSDFYIFPLLYKKGGNHAGGKVAFMTQGTGWVVAHEVGHLLGLGHSGAYKGDEYLAYGDNGYSVMADALGSKFIAPSQMYHLGWLKPDQMAVFDPKVKEYVFGSADQYFKGPGLGVVMIAPALLSEEGKGRMGAIGPLPDCPKCVAFYYVQGGGSSRVQIIRDEWKDPKTKLHVKVLADGSTGRKVMIEIMP